MVAPIAAWATLPSRRTPSRPTAEVCVEAYTDLNPAGENGIRDVRFDITLLTNLGYSSSVTVSERALRSPDHNDPLVGCPIPGAPAGRMAYIKAYGFTMDLGGYPAGVLQITATVRTWAGSTYVLPDKLTILNDTDGGDRRASKKEIHVNQATGNDANDGLSEVTAVSSLNVAIGLCRNNTAGTTLADRDCANAIIRVHGPVFQLAGPAGALPQWHTSNFQFIEVYFDLGTIVERDNTNYEIFARGVDGVNCECNVKFVLPYVRGLGGAMSVYGTNVTARFWVDGGLQSSRYSHVADSVNGKPWSVRFLEDDGEIMGFSGNFHSGCRLYATNSWAIGKFSNGYSGWSVVQQCVVSNFIGVGIQIHGTAWGIPYVGTAIIQGQRALKDVAGRADTYLNGATITPLSGNRMKVQANGPAYFSAYGQPAFSVPCDLLTLAEIIPSPRFNVHVSGSAFTQNNSPSGSQGNPAGNPVTEVGTGVNGHPYFVLQMSGPAQAETTGPAFYVRTCLKITGGAPIGDLAHGDILYFQGDQNGTIVSNVAARDIDQAQTYFNSSSNLIRCAMVNCHDGPNGRLTAPFGGGSSYQDSVFIGNTITEWAWAAGHISTGMNIVNNVMEWNSPLPAAGGGNFITHNHFVNGPASGANATTGTWFDPATQFHSAPWSPQPMLSRMDTGSPLYPTPPEFRWPGSTGTTRGVDHSVGHFDWSVQTAGSPIDGVMVVSLAFALTTTASLGITGDITMPLPLTLDAIGDVTDPNAIRCQMTWDDKIRFSLAVDPKDSVFGVYMEEASAEVITYGDMSLTLPSLTFTSAARLQILGDATISLALTLVADAESGTTGDLDATLASLALAADAIVDVFGDADITLDALTLDAIALDADVPIDGDADIALDALTLVAVGSAEITAGLTATLRAVSLTAIGSVSGAESGQGSEGIGVLPIAPVPQGSGGGASAGLGGELPWTPPSLPSVGRGRRRRRR